MKKILVLATLIMLGLPLCRAEAQLSRPTAPRDSVKFFANILLAAAGPTIPVDEASEIGFGYHGGVLFYLPFDRRFLLSTGAEYRFVGRGYYTYPTWMPAMVPPDGGGDREYRMDVAEFLSIPVALHYRLAPHSNWTIFSGPSLDFRNAAMSEGPYLNAIAGIEDLSPVFVVGLEAAVPMSRGYVNSMQQARAPISFSFEFGWRLFSIE